MKYDSWWSAKIYVDDKPERAVESKTLRKTTSAALFLVKVLERQGYNVTEVKIEKEEGIW